MYIHPFLLVVIAGLILAAIESYFAVRNEFEEVSLYITASFLLSVVVLADSRFNETWKYLAIGWLVWRASIIPYLGGFGILLRGST